jgi:hypothetical protein
LQSETLKKPTTACMSIPILWEVKFFGWSGRTFLSRVGSTAMLGVKWRYCSGRRMIINGYYL